jgi:hypothetical protein
MLRTEGSTNFAKRPRNKQAGSFLTKMMKLYEPFPGKFPSNVNKPVQPEITVNNLIIRFPIGRNEKPVRMDYFYSGNFLWEMLKKS